MWAGLLKAHGSWGMKSGLSFGLGPIVSLFWENVKQISKINKNKHNWDSVKLNFKNNIFMSKPKVRLVYSY